MHFCGRCDCSRLAWLMKRLGCMALFMACGLLAAQTPAVNQTGKGDLMASRVFTQAAGSVRTMANGGQSRDILYGTLATGEAINVHESTQPAGAKPNPLHT